MKNLYRVLFEDSIREEFKSFQYTKRHEDGPIGCYLTTPWGRFLDADTGLVEMLGYPDKESLMAISTADLYVNISDYERWQYLMARKGVVYNFEMELRRRDGERIWVSDTGRVIRDESGQMLYYEGTLEDISKLKMGGVLSASGGSEMA